MTLEEIYLEEIYLDKKHFYLNMKNLIIYNNSQLKSLINDNKFLSVFYLDFDLIDKNLMKKENEIFLNSLQLKIDNNNCLISLINAFLKNNCKHEIIEDYIEGGIENDMIKIKYCKHCELTF